MRTFPQRFEDLDATSPSSSVALGLGLTLGTLDQSPFRQPGGRAGFRQPAAGRPSAGRYPARSRRSERGLIGAGLSARDDSLDHGHSVSPPIES